MARKDAPREDPPPGGGHLAVGIAGYLVALAALLTAAALHQTTSTASGRQRFIDAAVSEEAAFVPHRPVLH